MSSFQQICPSCTAKLELPIEADGKSAVCPACQAQFVAVATSNTVSSNAPEQRPVPLRVRTVSIESVIGETQSIFADRRRPLILPFLIPSVLIVVGLVVPLAYLSDIAIVNRIRGLAWTGVLSPWFLLVSTYAFWFALNLSVDVCNAGPQLESETPESIRSRFLPRGHVFIALLMIIAAGAAVCAVSFGVAAAFINSGRTVEAFEIRFLMTFGALIGAVVLPTVVATRFWPLLPLAMDQHFGPSAVRQSLAITRANLLTSFLFIVAILILMGVGFSILGLGLPIAVPISALALVVALRLMQGQRIAALERDAM